MIFKSYFFDGHPLYQNITNKSCGFCILKAWFLAPLCAACEMSKLSYFRLKLNNGKPSYCHNTPLPYRTVKINYNSKTLYKYNVFNTNIPLSLIYEHFINPTLIAINGCCFCWYRKDCHRKYQLYRSTDGDQDVIQKFPHKAKEPKVINSVVTTHIDGLGNQEIKFFLRFIWSSEGTWTIWLTLPHSNVIKICPTYKKKPH